ncbi:MAG: STAS domain-containing protein [Pseudomonadota bacterium]|nr:STAS domain-containing protein [Pseudomonadota bacterium]
MSDGFDGERAASPEDEPSCEVCEHENPHFAAGDRWLLAGALTVDTAANVLEASREAALPGTGIVSFAAVDTADSAAVAVLLAWRRRAASEGKDLSFVDVPASLSALAELYGVEELISQPVKTAA